MVERAASTPQGKPRSLPLASDLGWGGLGGATSVARLRKVQPYRTFKHALRHLLEHLSESMSPDLPGGRRAPRGPCPLGRVPGKAALRPPPEALCAEGSPRAQRQ